VRPSRLLIYDGGCGLCQRSVRIVSRLDWLKRVRFADVDRDWDTLSHDHPALRRDACLAAMHVITRTGRILAGFDAFRALAAVLPPGWVALPVLYFPGVPAIGRRVYRLIASRRKTTTCTVPRRR
jgi:predicted DCC family thiol-disulfide oxidoreductase YuxK